MTTPPRRLGRGLSSLIQVTAEKYDTPSSPGDPAGNAPATTPRRSDDVDGEATKSEHSATNSVGSPSTQPGGPRPIRLEEIVPNRQQPRREFNAESIGQLAASIARHGLVQPLVVRPVASLQDSQGVVKYELIAGERRWRASRAAGIEAVPVIVREVDNQESLELALIENLQREDLNAIDRAEAYSRYCREFDTKPEDLAGRLNEDRTTVVNYLRLLELPSAVKDLVASGALSMGHARAILGATGADERAALARSVVENGLSVRALEEVMRRRRDSKPAQPAATVPASKSRDVSAHVVELETRFQQALGTKVKIKPGRGKGRGKITIEYYSFDDFDRIMSRMGVASEQG